MKNETSIKVPKKYVERIKEIYHDDDGYWVITNPGWRNGCDSECHVIHEDTKTAILQNIRWTEPCDCEECIQRLKQKTP